MCLFDLKIWMIAVEPAWLVSCRDLIHSPAVRSSSISMSMKITHFKPSALSGFFSGSSSRFETGLNPSRDSVSTSSVSLDSGSEHIFLFRQNLSLPTGLRAGPS